MARSAKVLAIGIDSLEPTYLQRLLDDGALPHLHGLMDGQPLREVLSPTQVGSGSVWPTFITGQEPAVHGVHSEWMWHPDDMRVAPLRNRGLRPFWSDLASTGMRVGVLDVPFSPLVGLQDGFEVSEWGAHDVVTGRLEWGPSGIGEILGRTTRHPFGQGLVRFTSPDDPRSRVRVAEHAVHGIRLRTDLAEELVTTAEPELAVVVFSEFHEAAHYLWHEAEPRHSMFEGLHLQPTEPSLRAICVELDRAVGRLAQRAERAVVLFSLHGMRPGVGISTVLQPLLTIWGLSVAPKRTSRSPGDQARAGLAWLKARAPDRLRALYQRRAPGRLQLRLAQPTMVPPLDWRRTSAVSLPSDQHGWVRLNLAGRERSGSLSPGQYGSLLAELADRLTDATAGGASLAESLLRPERAGSPTTHRLPDLVVHWADAALRPGILIDTTDVRTTAVARHRTGQHRGPGLLVWAGATPDELGASVAAADIGGLLSRAATQ